ncbi:DUF3267 domain-containing protein [Sphingobacterium suaedae]|uniref:DUF3267 domain-containing protein n=1 Tax=Sphingobacterium suaedae TaxID=1686402 RepID=A0ABW5KF64_9SPHI
MFEQYDKQEKRTIDLARANRVGCLLYVPIFLFYMLPFYFFWPEKLRRDHIIGLMAADTNPGLVLLSVVCLLVAGIILHEFIHGTIWALFARGGWKAIRFGVRWRYMTPYCHCQEPLTVGQYSLGAIMPFLILGLLPGVISWVLGDLLWLGFATFFSVAATGDFMVIDLMRKESRDTLVLDHPSEAGYYVGVRKEK